MECETQPGAARTPPAPPAHWPAKVDLFGVQVSPVTYDEAIAAILRAAEEGRAGIVSCHAAHAIVTASNDAELRHQVNGFDLVTPDGQPVRWALNWLHRTRLADRVYGPELMRRLCLAAAERGISVYLYGGTPEVAEVLPGRLAELAPRLKIAGAESPPFRPLTPSEDEALVARIRASGAGLVFIGLGCPKQDRFAHAHRDAIPAVQLCVGAAFDFLAGAKRMAPSWMQRWGLEWLFRLTTEPGRLWRRYLVTNSQFVWKLVWASLRKANS